MKGPNTPVLANEPDWPEDPVPWGITIRGNRFLRGGTCLGYADRRLLLARLPQLQSEAWPRP